MKALALATSSSPLSRLIARTFTGLPAYSACSFARVGISLTQGAHQVAHRFTTTTWSLSPAKSSGLPAWSWATMVASDEGVGTNTSLVISPLARDLTSAPPPPGLMTSTTTAYRSAAIAITPAPAHTSRVFPPALALLSWTSLI